MVGDENDDVPEYFQLLSLGGLTVPSVHMAEYVCGAFAKMADKF